MPRTDVAEVVIPAPYVASPLATVAWIAGDAGNGNKIRLTGNQVLLVWNSGAGARTITVASAPDSHGRLGDITALSLAAGEIRAFAKFPLSGWQQPDGYLYLTPEHAEVKYIVLDLSSQPNA